MSFLRRLLRRDLLPSTPAAPMSQVVEISPTPGFWTTTEPKKKKVPKGILRDWRMYATMLLRRDLWVLPAEQPLMNIGDQFFSRMGIWMEVKAVYDLDDEWLYCCGPASNCPNIFDPYWHPSAKDPSRKDSHMSTHSLKEPDRCPDCKELLEIASNADPQKGNVPKPGDISFCYACGCALIFGKQMEMTRLPSHMLDVEGRYIQDQIRELRKKDEALII